MMILHRWSSVIAATAVAVGAMAGIGWAASFSVTSAALGADSVSTPVMFPVSVTTTNGGGTAGKIEANDTITFVWSQKVSLPTMCSSWSNSQSAYTLWMIWTVQDNTGATGNDVLVPGSTGTACASGLHVGSVDLGSPNYISGQTTLWVLPTNVTVGASTTSLTVTWNGLRFGGALGTVTSGSPAVWTPDSAVTDRSGNTCGSNLSQSAASVLF